MQLHHLGLLEMLNFLKKINHIRLQRRILEKLRRRKNIFTCSIECINKRPNDSSFQFSPIFYSFCVESFSLKNHNKTILEIRNFVDSKDFRLTIKNSVVIYE